VTLLAFVVLTVLFIIGISLNSSATNQIRQNYRFKIQEKMTALGDAFSDLAKKVTEEKASNNEFNDLFKNLKPGNKSSEVQVFEIETDDQGNIVSGGNLGSYQQALNDLVMPSPNGEKAPKFEVEALVSFTRKKDEFPTRGDYAQDPNEFKGTANLTVNFSSYIRIVKNGALAWLDTGPKTLRTEFEFKRVKLQPQAVRHFSFFGQDVSANTKENHADYTKGKYNTLYVNSQGEHMAGGCLLLNSGTLQSPLKDQGNPFKDQIGYVLLGTGGDSEKGIYLNLTAGNSQISESFQLYRGKKGESDFYQLYTSDYASVLKDTEKIKSDRDVGAEIESVKKFLKLQGQQTDPVSGLAYYYLARKDYGYADEWKKHPEFGFTLNYDPNQPKKGVIPASSFHLFGAGGDGSQRAWSVVFGNVYRRCLSLSGYKQVKKKLPAGAKKRGFEVQAGPIYFYRKWKDLHDHKLYLSKKVDTKTRNDPKYAPIEVWDSRMNWKWPTSGTEVDAIKGSWTFVSGDGLMLRLIPAVKKLFSKGKGKMLFKHAVGTPDEDFYKNILNQFSEGTFNDNIVVSPFISQLFQSGHSRLSAVMGADDKCLFKVQNNKLVWTPAAKKLSAYVREVLLMFYFNSYTAYKNSQKSSLDLDVDIYGDTVQKAAKEWEKILKLVDKLGPNGDYYKFERYRARWAKKSRVFRAFGWNDNQNSQEKPVFYFTLPDPWQIFSNREGVSGWTQSTNFGGGADQGNRGYLDKVVQSFGDNGTGGEDLFNKYFMKIMTDPAWVLPYNYSLRFGIPDFKSMYFTSDPSEREHKMANEVIPELRDSIGYFDQKVNPYMDPGNSEDLKNAPLNTELQSRIIKGVREGKIKDAYYFAKELGGSVDNLEELELDNLYSGRCSFYYDKSRKNVFKEKYLSDGSKFHSTICVEGELELPTGTMEGSGVLWVSGPVTIAGDFEAPELVIIAPKITVKKPGANVKASLIVHKANPFSFNLSSLDGNLVVKKFDQISSRRDPRALNYNAGFLKKESYSVAFQPYIKVWGMEVGK
jgi:hypothetical protein